MAVNTTTQQMTRREARAWTDQRGIERLPQMDEALHFVPAGSYNEYNLERTANGFALTSVVLS